MPKLPIKVFKGLFYEKADRLFVQDPDLGEHDVESALQELVGLGVILSASHLPPGDHREHLTSPGIGSCLSGPSCTAGHVTDPTFLWATRFEGTLNRTPEGSFYVGEGRPLELRRFLVGHYGRVAVCAALKVNLDASYSDLSQEVDELLGVLQGLQAHVKSGDS